MVKRCSNDVNGAIAGLVGITAGLTPSPLAAIFIGAIAGILMYFSTKLLFKMKIDDVVGAIPAHSSRSMGNSSSSFN